MYAVEIGMAEAADLNSTKEGLCASGGGFMSTCMGAYWGSPDSGLVALYEALSCGHVSHEAFVHYMIFLRFSLVSRVTACKLTPCLMNVQLCSQRFWQDLKINSFNSLLIRHCRSNCMQVCGANVAEVCLRCFEPAHAHAHARSHCVGSFANYHKSAPEPLHVEMLLPCT